MLDIIIGNAVGGDQALINTVDDSFGNVMDLPDGSMRRHSILATVDINNDCGMMDKEV